MPGSILSKTGHSVSRCCAQLFGFRHGLDDVLEAAGAYALGGRVGNRIPDRKLAFGAGLGLRDSLSALRVQGSAIAPMQAVPSPAVLSALARHA